MKHSKSQKGITLVALVITIIVLLILAGISLKLVMGDGGILGRATDAAETNEEARVRELVNSALASLIEDYYKTKYAINNGNYDTSLIDYVTNNTGNVDIGDYYFTVSQNSENTKQYNIVVNNKTTNEPSYKGVVNPPTGLVVKALNPYNGS